jgi:predicted DsbA family dithiol-disulfide isomerase
MQVEIFSDVVCPWCAIGKRRFEAALAEFEHADQVEVTWRAFELDPGAPPEREGDLADRLAKKYGMTRQQALEANRSLTEVAAAEGLAFHFDRARPGNTFDAHRLLHWAKAEGLQGALKERLLLAYFTEGEPIGERETLVRLAADVGLDAEAAAEVLESGRYADDVRADEAEAQELGVSGVPFFVVDRRLGIPGAQDKDTVLRLLERAWERSHPLTVVPADPAAATCDGESCTL